MKRLWFIVDFLAVFMVVSVVVYVFTGLHLWAPVPLEENGMPEFGRSVGLVVTHVAFPFAAIMRRANF